MACSKIKTFPTCKDPDSDLPWSFTWKPFLDKEGALLVDASGNREIIITSDEDNDLNPLVVGIISVDIINGIIYVRLKGGTVGVKYLVTCRITTDTGLIEDLSGYISCAEK